MSIPSIMENGSEDDPLLPQRQVRVRVSVTKKSQEIAQNTPLKSSRLHHSLSPRRIMSLDIFRGLTMVGMILVDNQGDFNHVFWPLDESKWNGLRPSDTVFPSFIFIMGISIALIMPKWAELSRKQVWRVLRRIIVLFILGVYFNMQGSNFSSIFRIMGVLQRLALTYGVAAFAHAFLGVTLQRVLMGFLLFTYSMIMYLYDVPTNGCGRGKLTKSCNAGAYLDHKVLGDYMMHPTDPEGLVTTTSACLTILLGLEFGRWFKTLAFERPGRTTVNGSSSSASSSPITSPSTPPQPSPRPSNALLSSASASGAPSTSSSSPHHLHPTIKWFSTTMTFILIGAILAAFGWSPICKKIWSISFVLITSSIIALCLFLCYIVFDVISGLDSGGFQHKQSPSWTTRSWLETVFQPCVWLGRNPLLVFLGMVFIEVVMLDNIHIGNRSLWKWTYDEAYASWIGDKTLASFLFAFTHLIIWTAISGILHWKKWYFKR
eukprot:TRINITY_DN916_c0_g1_i1.p1 TRINITY_DN916_c0_g1~~TRINITY_DN916_c0_g1_i1.p1  ORF type:complete len:490 (-),score=85.76 TRINITY_DN916_c0_g1_i1:5-1474(-)